MSTRTIEDLQADIGHHFNNQSLIERALTHSSLSGGMEPVADLERLEFLGDRVLGLMTAETLWRRYPHLKEGELAPRFNALVRKETCARAAVFWGLDGLMRLSPQEDSAGGRKKTAILGDVCEAFLGALYIDGGLEVAYKAYNTYWIPNFDQLMRHYKDAKTALQEWSQEKKLGSPRYDVLEADGPAHAPAYRVAVRIKGYKRAEGNGGSKRMAQRAAAEAFLLREKIWSGEHD